MAHGLTAAACRDDGVGVKLMPLSLPQFVERWKACALTERSAAQSHFIDLCEVLAEPHPAAADQVGDTYTFEKHVSKLKGGKGFADVWRRGFFAWEYKGKHKNLVAAYEQLVDYREDLENPPLLVVCDLERFEVHTNFTGTPKRVYCFALSDLLASAPTPTCALPPLDVLRALFTEPSLLRPERADARVTESAAAEFAKLAQSLHGRGVEPEKAAHFLMRLLFCLFADSIGLLPDNLFRQMLALDKGKPASFTRKLRQLFAAMSTSGSNFGMYDIHYFNGGLFADDEAYDLTGPDLVSIRAAAALNWSHVEPAIFGTLFERSLDPGKRAQLGAHYTSTEDILLIVEPVIVAPLSRRWQEVKTIAEKIDAQAQSAKGNVYIKLRAQLQDTLFAWVEELSKVRVLDAACGSGNFLYVALRRMLDLWKEVYLFTALHGLPTFLPHQVHPSQLLGLETNVYAHELASVVVWIGYLQWLNDNGIGWPTEPILRKLDNIQHRDAILAFDPEGRAIEPDWPNANFIIGNPPWLGGKKFRSTLGDECTDAMFRVYAGRVSAEADLVMYWFEKARGLVEQGVTDRVGLLATQAVRQGANRRTLDRIIETGAIFMAWSDKEWVLDGAQVRSSIVAFDNGSERLRTLDGEPVDAIYANLQTGNDLTKAARLVENRGLAFQGPVKVGKFEITNDLAQDMLSNPNVNGISNSAVVKPWINGADIVDRPLHRWIIDFSLRTEEEAALFEAPFEHLKSMVKEERRKNRDRQRREKWWRLGRSGGDVKAATATLSRYLATSRVSKHRFFTWWPIDTVPDTRVVVIAKDSDYFAGALHSRVHIVWFLATSSRHGVGNDPTYNTEGVFETFAFPWPPGKEPVGSPLVDAIAEECRQLMVKRDAWLNPPLISDTDLKARTLTSLYNAAPTWLLDAHRNLDEAVFAAYGWPSTLTNDELLERLLALNHDRAAVQPIS